MLNWVVAFFALVGTILNVKKMRIGFAIWAFTNAYWAAYNFTIQEYAQSTLMFVYFCLAVWGFFSWKDSGSSEEKKEND